MNARQHAMSIRTGSNSRRDPMFNRSHGPRQMRIIRVTIGAMCVLLPARQVLATAPTVTAVRSSSETAMGQPVQLQIKVTGSNSARPPAAIAVDGLDIRYSGQSQLLEGHNFQFSYSSIFSYTVMPLKGGTFKIPPQNAQASGSARRTPELTLNVGAESSAPSSRSGRR